MKKIINISILIFSIITLFIFTGCAKSTPSNEFSVTFNSNGGTPVESQTVEKGNKVVEPTQPTKEGYTFDGWYLNDEKWSFIGYVVTEDITLVAKWNINTYNITYDLNGGTLSNTNPSTYTIEDNITLNNPIKEHYTFIGWTSEEITTPTMNITKNNQTGDKHYIANYVVNSYTVKFYDYDNELLKEEQVEYLSNATPPVDPTREHYSFTGWDKNYTNIISNLEIKAQYAPVTYRVTFDSDGGSSVSNIEFTVETQDIELPTPTKERYDFLGWYEGNILVETFEYRDYNLIAKWEKIEIDIDLDIYEENGYTYINLGRYPQTVVIDTSIINALSTITSTNELGYYEYNGNEYAKVVANPFESGYKFINGTTITKNNTYYFLVEPIKWRVLEENNGTYTLLSEMIIDNTAFYYTWDEVRTINGVTIYPNNYEYSNVRAWLNGYDGSSYNVDNYTNKGFLNIAFTEEEQLLINTTLVDNSLESTGDSDNGYICNNTQDKIYLLSVKDTLNTNYGFSNSIFSHELREAVVSDYVRSKYCWMYTSSSPYGNGYWWLRSPSYGDSRYYNRAYVVHYYGSLRNNDFYVSREYSGVRPALIITIE